MHKPALAACVVLAVLGGCGGARLNPVTWFGSDTRETVAPATGWDTEVDRRALVPNVTAMELMRTPEGGVLRARGRTETQGWWDVQLRPTNDGDPVAGTLIYEFVAAEPRGRVRTGPAPSRSVDAAVKLTNADLAGVRRVVVRGAQNARSLRR